MIIINEINEIYESLSLRWKKVIMSQSFICIHRFFVFCFKGQFSISSALFLGGHHLYMYFCVSACVSLRPFGNQFSLSVPPSNIFVITLYMYIKCPYLCICYVYYKMSVPSLIYLLYIKYKCPPPPPCSVIFNL